MDEVVPLAMFAFVFVFFCIEYCSWCTNYVQHLPINREDVLAVCDLVPSQVEKARQELVAGVPGVGPEGHFSCPHVQTR